MKDTDLRGAMLNKLYEMRRDAHFVPHPEDFPFDFSLLDILHIVEQLDQHQLVKAEFIRALSGSSTLVQCRISALGIDTVESGSSPNLRINLVPQQNITISGSSNVVVGNNNQQTVNHSVQELVRVIESSTASPEQKEEAKGLLKQFLAHPLLSAIVGSAISLL